MNENLRCALLGAGLSEEDVAARLRVDPKTVRRWLDGRLPYLRHRWALAAMLGANETDLWPGLRASPARPAEVRAIYPNLAAVPPGTWLSLFSSAQRDIGILADDPWPSAENPALEAVLAERSRARVRIRVCLVRAGRGVGGSALLCLPASAEVRVSQAPLYNSIYRADSQLLISQRAYGISPSLSPVLWLDAAAEDGMVGTYLQEFARLWATSRRNQ